MNSQKESRPSESLPDGRQAPPGCPPAAELIQFALGQGTQEARKRIETHLVQEECGQCRGWVEKTKRIQNDPAPESPPAFNSWPNSAAHIPSNLNPEKWQREALRDLERRLLLLEENQQ